MSHTLQSYVKPECWHGHRRPGIDQIGSEFEVLSVTRSLKTLSTAYHMRQYHGIYHITDIPEAGRDILKTAQLATDIVISFV